MGTRAWLSAVLLVCLSPSLDVGARAEFDEVIDSPMYRLPELSFAHVVMKFPEGTTTLWSRALEGPDAEIKCRVAQAILEAHQHGIKGMETTIPPLIAACEKTDQPISVRLAAARALVGLDAREAADCLFRQAQSGDSELRSTIEPALARWDHRPAREMWLQRLREPTTRHRDLVLAIRGLAAVGEQRAVDRLLEITLDKQAQGPIRAEAARGLGQLRKEGLHHDAERLAADASPRAIVARLAAAWLLRRHQSPESIRIMQRLARDAELTVAAVAVARLLEIDPELLVPALDDLLANPDAALRSFAVDVLRRRPTEKHVQLLSKRLDDVHIDVRRKARRYLLELAGEAKWRKQIIADATTILNDRQARQRWRDLEQATILLTQLDQKQVAGRLVELLRSPRAEVYVTAAWGLRKLDVPETLPGVVRSVDDVLRALPERSRHRLADLPMFEARDHMLSQLLQFMGQRKYRPPEALLKGFVPKFAYGFRGECRAAAVWALGMILDGQTDDALAAQLVVRLKDTGGGGNPPEDFRVRWMCAITLGRMKAKGALNDLRSFCPGFKPSVEHVGNACGWAIERMTGQKMPPPETIIHYQSNWFLVPDKWGFRWEPADAPRRVVACRADSA